MDDAPILDASWPVDLKPSDVPFQKRTRTVLVRQGFFEDPSMFDTLTASEVARWWNAGPVTVEDIRVAGSQAIRIHQETSCLRSRLDYDLYAAAREPWASRVWHRDPRFAMFVPKADSTVSVIAISGSAAERRYLWNRLDGLRAAVEAQGVLSLREAVRECVEYVSGQHGERLDVLLAVTGLNGCDAISGGEAARLLKVSHQRIHQLVQQLRRGLERARPRQGLWLPQFTAAEEAEWPREYSRRGVDVTRAIFGRSVR